MFFSCNSKHQKHKVLVPENFKLIDDWQRYIFLVAPYTTDPTLRTCGTRNLILHTTCCDKTL